MLRVKSSPWRSAALRQEMKNHSLKYSNLHENRGVRRRVTGFMKDGAGAGFGGDPRRMGSPNITKT
jgi:hypothetical protein